MENRDILLTSPKSKVAIVEQEHETAWFEDGFFFRTFRKRPTSLKIGTRIFYIENGFIIGFFCVSEIKEGEMTCGTTGKDWGHGFHAIMKTPSWSWIYPIPMKGFQGWRYFPQELLKDVKLFADWRGDPIEN